MEENGMLDCKADDVPMDLSIKLLLDKQEPYSHCD